MSNRRLTFGLIAAALVLALITLIVAYQRILSGDGEDSHVENFRHLSERASISNRKTSAQRRTQQSVAVDVEAESEQLAEQRFKSLKNRNGAAERLLDAEEFGGSAGSSDILSSADGDILNNPFVDLLKGYYNGTRSFSHVCAIPTQNRIEVKAMSGEQRRLVAEGDSTRITFYKGEHFLIRDVCALGHFPKELTHLFTHVWRHVVSASKDAPRRRKLLAEYEALMKERRKVRAGSNGVQNNADTAAENAEPVDDLERLYYVLAPKVAPHVIIGNACVSRLMPGSPSSVALPSTGKHRGNKHTGVFHKVMVHWIRAIMYPWLDAARSQGSMVFKDEVSTYLGNAAVETDENKYLPFGRGGRHPDDGTPQQGVFIDPISVYEDYLSDPETQKPRRLVCFERLYEREERWRWFPNFEVAHRFRLMLWRYYAPLKAMHRKRIYNLLTVPFALQDKPKVLILRRDEDRHFNEKQAHEFIKEKFGDVADIKLVQYDRGGGHVPPSYYHQALELSTADVVVAAHGAALSSAMLMRPGAVLIELFPHNFRYYMYEELAKVMGLEYVAYEGERVSPNGCCGGRDWAGAGSSSQSIALNADGGEENRGNEGEENAPLPTLPVDDSYLLNFSSKGDSYVQMHRNQRLKLIGKIYDLHGNRNCKKCDIEVDKSQWYELMKNSLASVWLANSRLSNLHDFDLRK